MSDTTYRLPKRFYFDHLARDCEGGTIDRETKAHVFVSLDQASYDDLLSDAAYYFDSSHFDSYYRGLCASARATHRALVAVGPPA